ncbi:hypothetical protein WJX82_001577 [Trebouxia sp. C0006]
MHPVQQQRSFSTTATAQHQGALIQHKILPKCYVIAGVSGSGKSTVGRMLATRLQCPFYEGDDYHPKANKDKMHSGIPLQDADRWPWLQTLANIIHQHIVRDELAVVACSALKQRYRDILSGQDEGSEHVKEVAFVLLQPSKDVLTQRVQQRAAEGTHFMPASLLESQLALMEVDSSAYRYDAQPPSAIVDGLMALRETESH